MGVEGPHALNRDGGHGVQQCTDVRAGARPTEHLADLVRESPGDREPDQLVVPREGVAALKLRTHMHLSRHVFDGHGGGFDKELDLHVVNGQRVVFTDAPQPVGIDVAEMPDQTKVLIVFED